MTDSTTLRAQLMAADPMQRVMALHALEQASASRNAKLAGEVEKFAARGIPFYAPHDANYQAWVGRAIAYWEKLHEGGASATH